ncbi:MAG: DUF6600 domain-containing protein [Verrucomicrobiia bacterium]
MKTRPWGVYKKVIVATATLLAIASGLFVFAFYNTALQADEKKSESAANSGNSQKMNLQTNAVSLSTNFVDISTNSNSTNAGAVLFKAPPDFSALNLKPELEEIVKMAQSGIDEEVLKQYVVQSKYSYKDLTARDIITLNDLGVPASVVSEMLKKTGKPELEQQPEEQKMVVASTNETITATAETQMAGAQTEQRTEQAITNQQPPQATQTAPPVYVQTVTQTVYVPVQTEQQPQVIVQQQPVVVQQPVPETVVVYYSALSPYGSWLYVDGYGYCWQPLVAVTYPGWRPYYHGGRWLWTDYGWYWLSDYSWGWATFHYGRWSYLHHHGWVWFPDRVWGPAWVSWRVGPSYCGWAPLPPYARYDVGVGFVYHGSHVSIGFEFGLSDWDYTFVDWGHFHHRYPYRYGVPGNRARDIYNNTTVINNYITGNNNNVVINTGVGTEHITRLTREEIRKVTVRDAPVVVGNRTTISPERLVKDGNNIVLYRPNPQQTPLLAKANPQQIAPKFVPVSKLQGEAAGKTVLPTIPKQTVSSNLKSIPSAAPQKGDIKSSGVKSALPVTTAPLQVAPQPSAGNIESIKGRQPILNENKGVISQPSRTQTAPVKSLPGNVAPSAPSAKPLAPSKEALPAQKPVPQKMEVAKTEPAKQTQPLVTHLWSQSADSSKASGSKPDPILSKPNYPSSTVSPIINSPKPATAITPSQSTTPPLGIRYRSPSTPAAPSVPVNPHLAPGSLDTLNQASRQSSARIAPSIPAQVNPAPLPVQQTPSYIPTPRANVTPLPQAQPAPVPAQRSIPSYTPPAAGGTRVTPLPSPSPAYTPPQTPSYHSAPRYEAPKSSGYSAPPSGGAGYSRSYGPSPSPGYSAPSSPRGGGEFGRSR